MKKVALFDHNVVTYAEMLDTLVYDVGVAIVQATGSGKNAMLTRYLQDFPEKKILVVAPSLDSIKETFKELDWEPNKRTTLITYSKLCRLNTVELIRAFGLSGIDTIILDEFHHAGAEKWGKGVYALLEANAGAKRIGFSATPYRYGDAIAPQRNMAEELFNGNVISNLDLENAFKKKVFQRPVYVTAFYKAEKVLAEEVKKLKDNACLSVSERNKIIAWLLTEAQHMDLGNKLKMTIHNYVNQEFTGQANVKFVVFFANINVLENEGDTVKQWFTGLRDTVKTYCVHSGYKAKAMDKAIDEFKTPHGSCVDLLFCVNKLNESVHVQGVDGLMFLRATGSANLYFQQLGRGFVAGSKKRVLVFDLVENYDSVSVSYYGSKYGNGGKAASGEHSENLWVIRPSEIHDERQDVLKLFETVHQRVHDTEKPWYENTSTASWVVGYDKVKTFVDHFHQLPDMDGMDEESVWLRLQMALAKAGKLLDAQIVKLRELGLDVEVSGDNTIIADNTDVTIEKLQSMPRAVCESTAVTSVVVRGSVLYAGMQVNKADAQDGSVYWDFAYWNFMNWAARENPHRFKSLVTDQKMPLCVECNTTGLTPGARELDKLPGFAVVAPGKGDYTTAFSEACAALGIEKSLVKLHLVRL